MQYSTIYIALILFLKKKKLYQFYTHKPTFQNMHREQLDLISYWKKKTLKLCII